MAAVTRAHRRRSAVATAVGRPAWTVRLTRRITLAVATSTPALRCQLQEIIRCHLDPPYRRHEPVLRFTGKLSVSVVTGSAFALEN